MHGQPKPNLKVDWATHDAARYACERWHYSRTTPTTKMARIGAWEDGAFIGVVLFGSGANRNIGSPYGLGQDRVCELTRVALREHRTPVSRIVMLAVKLLIKHNPMLKLIVSYADSAQNHHGGIYQAMNWVYVGKSRKMHVIVDGVAMHNRSATERFGTLKNEHVQWAQSKVKHTYILPLDADMKAVAARLATPYPKRINDAP